MFTRLRDRSGVYRVVYAVVTKTGVVLLHAFKKTSEKTPQHNVVIAQKRLKEARS